jgi:hypothetical protein
MNHEYPDWAAWKAEQRERADYAKSSGRLKSYLCTGGCKKVIWKSVESLKALKKRFNWKCINCREGEG